jgi:hypothetical protein
MDRLLFCPSATGIDHCYDCRAEVDVLTKYFELSARLNRVKQLGLYPPHSAYDFRDWIDHDVPADHPSRLANHVLLPSLAPDASFAELMTKVESITARLPQQPQSQPLAALSLPPAPESQQSSAAATGTAASSMDGAGDSVASASDSAGAAEPAESENVMNDESNRKSPIPLDSASASASASASSASSSSSSSSLSSSGPRPIRDWRHLWADQADLATMSAAELVPNMNERVSNFTEQISVEVSHGRRCLSQPQPPPDHRKGMSSLY